jgi:UDP-N-acetylmuramate dehydrogenase
VGGAVCGNAGAYGSEIGSVISRVVLYDSKGEIKTVDSSYCQFSYRHSCMKETGETVLRVQLELKSGSRESIESKVQEILAERSGKHPIDQPSAGSFFKNIPDQSEKHGKLPAGRLLEKVGAKGMTVGGAKVFEKHANIIINAGGATSKNISDLADILKEKVSSQFGIKLEEEIVRIGKF